MLAVLDDLSADGGFGRGQSCHSALSVVTIGIVILHISETGLRFDDLSPSYIGCLIDENAAASSHPPHMEGGQVS